ncbi:MAG: hypothetical protein ACI8TX_001399 [Hyphomicrobiaceae bacterium]
MKNLCSIFLSLVLWLFLSFVAAVPMLCASVASAAPRVGAELEARLAADGRVPVIVSIDESALGGKPLEILRSRVRSRQARVLARVEAADVTVSFRYETIPALAVVVTRAGLDQLLASPDVVAVDVDRPIKGLLGDSVAQINADDMQDVHGLTGSGIVVAVLDSGFDSDHPDLAGALVGERCFCQTFPVGACCPNGSGSQSGAGSAEDDNGHGTAVSGVITSDGTVASIGVAPAAQIYAIKVLNASGDGSVGSLLAGIDHVITDVPEARVVNMSLGGPTFMLPSVTIRVAPNGRCIRKRVRDHANVDPGMYLECGCSRCS